LVIARDLCHFPIDPDLCSFAAHIRREFGKNLFGLLVDNLNDHAMRFSVHLEREFIVLTKHICRIQCIDGLDDITGLGGQVHGSNRRSKISGCEVRFTELTSIEPP
jgi:hypothetical protein